MRIPGAVALRADLRLSGMGLDRDLARALHKRETIASYATLLSTLAYRPEGGMLMRQNPFRHSDLISSRGWPKVP